MEQTSQNVDVVELLKGAFNYVLNHKKLIVLGIIASFFGSSVVGSDPGSSVNFYNIDADSLERISRKWELQFEKFGDGALSNFTDLFVGSMALFWILGLLGCSIIFFLIALYVRNVAVNGIIIAGAKNDDKKESDVSLKELWLSGQNKLFHVILLDIMSFIASVIIGIVSFPLMCLCCAGVFTSLIGGIMLSWIYDMSKRYIVVDGVGLIDAIQASVDLVLNRFIDFLLYFVVNLAIAIVYIIAFFAVGVPMAIIVYVAMIAGIAGGPVVFVVMVGVFGLLAGIVLTVVSGPFVALSEVWKTRFWKEIKTKA